MYERGSTRGPNAMPTRVGLFLALLSASVPASVFGGVASTSRPERIQAAGEGLNWRTDQAAHDRS